MTIYESNSEEETYNIGKKLGEKADKGEIICLEGFCCGTFDRG